MNDSVSTLHAKATIHSNSSVDICPNLLLTSDTLYMKISLKNLEKIFTPNADELACSFQSIRNEFSFRAARELMFF